MKDLFEKYETQKIGEIWYIFRRGAVGIKTTVSRIAETYEENNAMMIVNALNSYDDAKISLPADTEER